MPSTSNRFISWPVSTHTTETEREPKLHTATRPSGSTATATGLLSMRAEVERRVPAEPCWRSTLIDDRKTRPSCSALSCARHDIPRHHRPFCAVRQHSCATSFESASRPREHAAMRIIPRALRACSTLRSRSAGSASSSAAGIGVERGRSRRAGRGRPTRCGSFSPQGPGKGVYFVRTRQTTPEGVAM